MKGFQVIQILEIQQLDHSWLSVETWSVLWYAPMHSKLPSETKVDELSRQEETRKDKLQCTTLMVIVTTLYNYFASLNLFLSTFAFSFTKCFHKNMVRTTMMKTCFSYIHCRTCIYYIYMYTSHWLLVSLKSQNTDKREIMRNNTLYTHK